MLIDIGQEVTPDPETQKNGMAEEEPPPEFETQTIGQAMHL